MKDLEPLVSEMVERVARALHVAIAGDDPDELIHHPAQKSWETPTWRRWEQWDEAARAAIEAMREPTRDMEWAATGRSQGADSTLYGSIYTAMIDAALADRSPLLTAEEGPGCKPPTSS